jgi:hypothetical protein
MLTYQRELGIDPIWDSDLIAPLVLRNLILMIFFYINLIFLTPYLLNNKGALRFLFVMIGSVAIVTFAISSINRAFFGAPEILIHHERKLGPGPVPPPILEPPRSRPLFLAGPFFFNFLTTAIVGSVSTLMVMWNKWNEAKQDEQERTLQKVAAELSVLKLQISPHFLFNTLNNIRWLVRSKSPHAEGAIMKLSQLLRYILYQTNSDRVPLQGEVKHLEDFISLQLMRISKKDRVSYNFRGAFDHHQIVPLLFIPPVENFFKYADFETDIVNEITLTVNENALEFTCRNKIAPALDYHDDSSSGIGLENLKRRLALHYPDRHRLYIENQKDFFEIRMKLDISQ